MKATSASRGSEEKVYQNFSLSILSRWRKKARDEVKNFSCVFDKEVQKQEKLFNLLPPFHSTLLISFDLDCKVLLANFSSTDADNSAVCRFRPSDCAGGSRDATQQHFLHPFKWTRFVAETIPDIINWIRNKTWFFRCRWIGNWMINIYGRCGQEKLLSQILSDSIRLQNQWQQRLHWISKLRFWFNSMFL